MKEKDLTLNRPTWPTYEETVLQSGGFTIVLSIFPSALPPNKSRGALVFSPGTGDHPLLFLHFLEGLASAGFDVVGIHFAGTGKSPRQGLRYRWSTFKQNVSDAVSYTRQRFGGPVGLVGTSQGGLLTLQMLAELEDIDLAICHNIGVPRETSSLDLTRLPSFIKSIRWLAQSLVTLTAAIFPNWAMPLGLYLREERLFMDPVLGRINREDPIKNRYLPYAFFAEFSTSAPREPIESMTTPILVLAAEQDKIFPLPYMRHFFERLGSKDKELAIFEGKGHMFMVENTDESLIPTLRWLDAHRAYPHPEAVS